MEYHFTARSPAAVLKPALLCIMLATALAMFMRPALVMPEAGTRCDTLREKPVGALWLFACGVYGGFAQAGIGFLLIATLAASTVVGVQARGAGVPDAPPC